jgi:hypothetical protein
MSERGLATTIKEFLSQDWLGVVGLIIGVVALWYAFYVRQRPRLAAQVNSLELVGSSPALPKELELLFRGEKVPKVTLSRVSIWNMGNVTLRREQIVAADPLLLVTSSGSKVLDARIIVRIREVKLLLFDPRIGE